MAGNPRSLRVHPDAGPGDPLLGKRDVWREEGDLAGVAGLLATKRRWEMQGSFQGSRRVSICFVL